MSFPSIPGYIDPVSGDSLDDLWHRPEGKFPSELWPAAQLRNITRNPTGWLTVEESFFADHNHGGAGCVLVMPDKATETLRHDRWIGRDLGSVGIWDDGTFESGLTANDREITVEFFVHGRRSSGSSLPIIEVSYPFLWYWDAFPVRSEWKYLNQAGREQDLIRWECTESSWKVEVRALEFRQFLAAYGRTAVIQVDYIPSTEAERFSRVESRFQEEWVSFSFHAMYDESVGRGPAYSRLLGQYLITDLRNSRVPRVEERYLDRDYPTFIYKLDSETGQPLSHTCNPDELGTYFDKDGTRLHYLTPIYFQREVLQPYAAEPTRYRISSSRLSCLDLWGIAISFNSAGLVEVYLGDLGRDLPPDEWGHWRTYNVPPEGTMDEGRFRRDFLNQWAASEDVVRDLQNSRDEAARVSREFLGVPIWKPLPVDTRAEFESLIGPLTNDPASLGPALLILTKALVDGIDPAPLKSYLKEYEKGDQSIRLLKRYAEELGDTSDVTDILGKLQHFRSKGGVAHLAGSQGDKAASVLGIAGFSNIEAFKSVVMRTTACLRAITELTSQALDQSSKKSPGRT